MRRETPDRSRRTVVLQFSSIEWPVLALRDCCPRWAIWCRSIGAIAVAFIFTACGGPQLPSYGNFGGPPRPQPAAPMPATPEGELIGAEHQVRWYPRSARFSPDESHLLVSLCHFRFSHYCRIARYWTAEHRWEVLPFESGSSAAWPDYSPDGRRIVFAQQRCEATYQCDGLGFALATMDRDGTNRRELGPVGVQMPTWSPDAKRLLYWRLNGVGRLASGRAIGSFDIYEYTLMPVPTTTPAETRITGDNYFGTYAAPRYLADGERILYSAYRGDDTGSYGYVVTREQARRLWSGTPRKQIAAWSGPPRSVLHGFYPGHGWLYHHGALRLRFDTETKSERVVLQDSRYHIGTADLSSSGKSAVALTGTPLGTTESGGAVAYFKISRHPSTEAVPVMSLIDMATGIGQPIADWPADVERVTQPRGRQ